MKQPQLEDGSSAILRRRIKTKLANEGGNLGVRKDTKFSAK